MILPTGVTTGKKTFHRISHKVIYSLEDRYALVHPDIRGSYRSEGDSRINSDQEGRDGYDLIEWIAEQEWSNGWHVTPIRLV